MAVEPSAGYPTVAAAYAVIGMPLVAILIATRRINALIITSLAAFVSGVVLIAWFNGGDLVWGATIGIAVAAVMGGLILEIGDYQKPTTGTSADPLSSVSFASSELREYWASDARVRQEQLVRFIVDVCGDGLSDHLRTNMDTKEAAQVVASAMIRQMWDSLSADIYGSDLVSSRATISQANATIQTMLERCDWEPVATMLSNRQDMREE